MTQNITLSAKFPHAASYVQSEDLTVAGYDAFIYVDSSNETYAHGYRASGVPEVNLVGFSVSAHRQAAKPVINVGDHVTIDGTAYELVSKRTRVSGSGDLALVPVQ